MAKHFISVLGTGLYEPVEYAFEGISLGKYEFIQEALIRQFQTELENDGRVSVFLTEGARNRNWENRTYNDRDVSATDKWAADEKVNVIPGNPKQGLKDTLSSAFGPALAIRDISIENASTESQIWSVFQTIYETIEDGDEIIFDITHSFRSIPMLAITILNFARIMKNCSVCGIYYGAYEAKGEDGLAPIVDLTIYNDILQWTSATDTFMRYGNADQIMQLYNSKKAFLQIHKKEEPQTKEWRTLGGIIASMGNLSDTLATCRGIDAEKIDCNKKQKPGKSIRCAYQKFKQEVEQEYPASVKEMVPLHQLLDKAKENYQPFDTDQDYQIGCEVVRWSIRSGMTQQGYTALEETVKTYLCYMYDIDNRLEQERDKIIGAMLTGFAQFLQKYPKEVTAENQYTASARENIRTYIINQDPVTSKLCQEGTPSKELLSKLDEIVQTLPIELARTSHKIKSKRNDINHFGFHKNPSSAKDLKSDLSKLFKEFESFVKEESASFTKRIVDYRSISP